MNSEIRPQPLAMSQSVVDDLHDRLERTRWPDAETVEDDSQGVPLSRLRALAAYWRDEYDWRKTERRVNALDPSVTTIDGVDIHFLHVRSPEPDAVPLIITHGWPSTTLELVKAARQLADPRAHGQDPRDAYHVVLPSLPGFGLSGKPRHTGWAPERIAVAWLELMRRLGYDWFVAQGGDWGASVTHALGAIGAPQVRAVHINMFATFGGVRAIDHEEERALERHRDSFENDSGYQFVQGQSPQTVGYALTDSPVGQAAWLYEKYDRWTDHDGDLESLLTRDELLDNISLYWLTGSAASSARIYWESRRSFPSRPVIVPIGYSQFPHDTYLASRRWVAERYPTLSYYNEAPRGGHFPAWEQPSLFADEVRASFRQSL